MIFLAAAMTGISAATAITAAAEASPPPEGATELLLPAGPGEYAAVSPAMRESLGLWPGRYPGYAGARLFQRADSSIVLQVEFARNGRAAQERVPLSTAETDALRRAVAEWVERQAALAPAERSGKLPLLLGATAVGLGFYSWALPSAADLEGREAVATGMLAVAGSFAVPLLLTRGTPVSAAAGDLTIHGASRGIAHGMLAHEWRGARGDASRERLTWGLVSSLVEGAAGHAWATTRGLSAGQARLIGVGADLGALWGYAAGTAFGTRGSPDQAEGNGIYGAVLSGSFLGTAGGAIRGTTSRPGVGEAEVVRTTSLIGSALLAAAADAFTDHGDTICGWLLAGGLAGAWAGDLLTREQPFSPGQAALVDLSTVAGAAFGIGATYLLGSSSSGDHEPFVVSGSIGAATGFGAACLLFRRGEARDRAAIEVERPAEGVAGGLSASLNLSCTPELPTAARPRPAQAGRSLMRAGLRLAW